MNRRARLILLGLTVLAILMLWQPWQPAEEEVVTTEPDAPDFTATELETWVFDAEGQLNHRIFATEMVHYSQRNLTEMVAPEYVTHAVQARDGQITSWQIQAERGAVQENRFLTLSGDVLMQNLSVTGYVREVRTNSLAIDLQNRTMNTDDTVTLTGQQFEMRGEGMRVSLEAQQMELVHHVETYYYPRAAD